MFGRCVWIAWFGGLRCVWRDEFGPCRFGEAVGGGFVGLVGLEVWFVVSGLG